MSWYYPHHSRQKDLPECPDTIQTTLDSKKKIYQNVPALSTPLDSQIYQNVPAMSTPFEAVRFTRLSGTIHTTRDSKIYQNVLVLLTPLD